MQAAINVLNNNIEVITLSKRDVYLMNNKYEWSEENRPLHTFKINLDLLAYREMHYFKNDSVVFDSSITAESLKAGDHVVLINKKTGFVSLREVRMVAGRLQYSFSDYYDQFLSDNTISMKTKRYDLLGKIVYRIWSVSK
ncbi:hypothetical protein [Paracholeplasma manati]|uniref:Peptidase S24/S26A/S26B/S26C domain-containing protein n=1 Tax=Paracholeplasma manati TaxID=591373 RepID=A0ABT2Y5C3_9MOLU|nr:hypothetical protein [Paracholeplasma manati]MCV2231931.1 hypothetical protein [Paracholeplasma manati]MDG0888916.1 hypothetical protein [Paracholeplasma manati]